MFEGGDASDGAGHIGSEITALGSGSDRTKAAIDRQYRTAA
jgi:hypothetical protein